MLLFGMKVWNNSHGTTPLRILLQLTHTIDALLVFFCKCSFCLHGNYSLYHKLRHLVEEDRMPVGIFDQALWGIRACSIAMYLYWFATCKIVRVHCLIVVIWNPLKSINFNRSCIFNHVASYVGLPDLEDASLDSKGPKKTMVSIETFKDFKDQN